MLLHRCRLLPRCRLQDVRLSHALPASVDAATRVLCWLRAGGLLRYGSIAGRRPPSFFLAGTAPHTPRFFRGAEASPALGQLFPLDSWQVRSCYVSQPVAD